MESMVEGKVTQLQFAANGKWERAFILSAATDVVSLRSWLGAEAGDFAFECFFRTPDGSERFFGIELNTMNLSAQICFCADVAVHFVQYQPRSTSNVLACVRHLLSHPSLFTSDPSFLEMGIVNAWHSSGPIRFWSCKCPGKVVDEFCIGLAASHRFNGLLSHKIAIEICYKNPLVHWIGCVVSDKRGGGFVINKSRAVDICRTVDDYLRAKQYE